MDSLTVIIPTLQKNLKVLNKLINILSPDECVSEIILIDNTTRGFTPYKSCKKLNVYVSDTNLYVNKSWNLGVELAQNDKFLIINDDILCSKNFCTKIMETGILDKDDTGLVGLSGSSIHSFDRNTTVDIKIPKNDYNLLKFKELEAFLYVGNWGSAFFGKKENYYPIPEIFTVIYGDNYLLQQNSINKKKNYMIEGIYFNHIQSLTSRDVDKDITLQDLDNGEKYFNIVTHFDISSVIYIDNAKIEIIEEEK